MTQTITARGETLTSRQRWGSNLCIVLTVVMVAAGLLLRANTLNATRVYQERRFGISVRYPATWLISENTAGYLFQVQDPAELPFKTTIRVTVLPIGAQARPEDILNELTVNRAARLQPYRSLGIEPIRLQNGADARLMNYAYSAVETNPFLQSEPIIVRAVDVVALRGNQAIVITYESDARSFEQNRTFFDRFLVTLDF